jgi:hypothetical protein
MTWHDILLIVSLVLLFGSSAWWLYQRTRKKITTPVIEELPQPPTISITEAAATLGITMAEPKLGERGRRFVDPGRGLATRAARRAARRTAWRPSTAARRAAHKALVLAGLEDEREG